MFESKIFETFLKRHEIEDYKNINIDPSFFKSLDETSYLSFSKPVQDKFDYKSYVEKLNFQKSALDYLNLYFEVNTDYRTTKHKIDLNQNKLT